MDVTLAILKKCYAVLYKPVPCERFRMAAKLFEIEMQITCTNVKKTTVMYVNYSAPVTDKKRLAVWAATPREAG